MELPLGVLRRRGRTGPPRSGEDAPPRRAETPEGGRDARPAGPRTSSDVVGCPEEGVVVVVVGGDQGPVHPEPPVVAEEPGVGRPPLYQVARVLARRAVVGVVRGRRVARVCRGAHAAGDEVMADLQEVPRGAQGPHVARLRRVSVLSTRQGTCQGASQESRTPGVVRERVPGPRAAQGTVVVREPLRPRVAPSAGPSAVRFVLRLARPMAPVVERRA